MSGVKPEQPNVRRGPRGATEVRIRTATVADGKAFVAAVRRSRDLHRPWIEPPDTIEGYRSWLAKLDARTPYQRHVGFVAIADGDLAGSINVSEIVHGAFRSAYLGYAAFVPWAGRGVMRQALRGHERYALTAEDWSP